jgi:hypothetical protein
LLFDNLPVIGRFSAVAVSDRSRWQRQRPVKESSLLAVVEWSDRIWLPADAEQPNDADDDRIRRCSTAASAVVRLSPLSERLVDMLPSLSNKLLQSIYSIGIFVKIKC